MKAAVFRDGRLVIDDVSEPQPSEGEVLVAVKACGICGSDLHFVDHGADFLRLSSEAYGLPRPMVDLSRDVRMGHEFSAEVIASGPNTNGPKPGTIVTSMPVLMRGGNRLSLSFSNSQAGAYGERMVLTNDLLVAAPSGADADRIALTEPLAVGLHAVNKSGIEKGTTALIIGCGPVGLTVIGCLKARGIGPIIASDYSAARRATALAMGADVVVDPATSDLFDVWKATDATQPMMLFEAVGAKGLINTAMRRVPRDTKIVVVGLCMQTDSFEPTYGVLKELTLQFVVTYTPDEFRDAMHLIADGTVDVSPMITGRVDLDGIAGAFRELAAPDKHTKILVVP
jgi:threonine dehydrogenase-like Zn-dependent dehydrogenase